MSKSVCILLTFALCRAWGQTETGNTVWTASMTGNSFFSPSRQGLHIAADARGNIYNAGAYSGELTVGSFLLPAIPNSYYFAKYSDEGSPVWAQVIQAISGLVVDAAGTSYTAGVISNALFVAASDTDGNALWRTNANVTQCSGITLHSNNLAIAGTLSADVRFGSNYVSFSPNGRYLASLDNQGRFRWAIQAGTNFALADISSDAAGNIYLAGSFVDSALVGTTHLSDPGRANVFVAKFNSSGALLWARQYANPNGYADVHVVADRAGNVYFVWRTAFRSFLLSKLSSAGGLLWQHSATSTDYADPLVSGLAVDSYGNPYVTGAFSFGLNFDDGFSLTSVGTHGFIAKYNPAGPVSGAFFGTPSANDIAVDSFGGVLTTGHSDNNGAAYIAKAAFSGASTPPVITSNPKDRGVVGGTTLSLAVAATSGGPVTYQWQFNGVNLAGATASVLQRPNMTASFAGAYRVIVGNASGSLTSAVANVFLAFVPSIGVQPVSQTLTLGSNVTLSVSASGTAPLAYQWLRDDTVLPAATSPTLNLVNLQPGHEGGYRVIVSNPWGSVTSIVACLDQVPSLQFQSTSYAVSEGGGFAPVFVTRAHRASGAVSVFVSTAPGDAYAGTDYAHVVQRLNWADGDVAPKMVQVSLINDTEVEANENFTLSLFSPSGDAVVGSPAVTSVVILDNDGPARIQFETPAITVHEEDLTAEMRVLRSGGGGQTCSVLFQTLDNTAIAGLDYMPTNGTLVFGPTDTLKSIFVPLIDDWTLEGRKAFVVRLHSPSNATLVASNAVVTIDDRTNSFAELFGHDLKIADFKNVSGGFSDWVQGTLVITNPSSSFSAPGQIIIGSSNFSVNAISPGGAIDVDIFARGGRTVGQTNYLSANLYEQTVNGLALQDSRAIFGFYYTAGGGPPSGGVPVGCCLTSGQPVPGIPYVTNLTIFGPDAVNEGGTTQYSARVVLSNGTNNDAPAIGWGVSAFNISKAGLLTTTHVSSNVAFYIFATNIFNAVTQVAGKIVTNRDLRARLAGAVRVSGNRHRITLTGPANRVYNMQETTNLNVWTDVALVTNLTGTLLWTNAPSTTLTQRFYRAREH